MLLCHIKALNVCFRFRFGNLSAMASPQDSGSTSKLPRRIKRRRFSAPLAAPLSLDVASSSSSLALGLENGELAGDTQTKDPGKVASSLAIRSVFGEPPTQQQAPSTPLEAQGRPPTGTTLEAQGRPPTGATLEAQGRPPTGATLEAQGRPPTGATLVARGRPPTLEAQRRQPTAGSEWDINLETLPPVSADLEIMDRIPDDKAPGAMALPPKEMFLGIENCIKGHLLHLAAEADDLQDDGETFQRYHLPGYG